MTDAWESTHSSQFQWPSANVAKDTKRRFEEIKKATSEVHYTLGEHKGEYTTTNTMPDPKGIKKVVLEEALQKDLRASHFSFGTRMDWASSSKADFAPPAEQKQPVDIPQVHKMEAPVMDTRDLLGTEEPQFHSEAMKQYCRFDDSNYHINPAIAALKKELLKTNLKLGRVPLTYDTAQKETFVPHDVSDPSSLRAANPSKTDKPTTPHGLSNIMFGDDDPDYRSEYMCSSGQKEKKLKEAFEWKPTRVEPHVQYAMDVASGKRRRASDAT